MTVKDSQVVAIHPSSTIDHRPEWVLYHEFVLTKKNYIRTVTEIKGEWLFKIAAPYFNPANIKNFETKKELEKVEREMIESKKRKNDEKPGSSQSQIYNNNILIKQNAQMYNNQKTGAGGYQSNYYYKRA